MAWRLAKSLIVLLNQVNQLYPNRSKRSDGTIGDVAHQKQGNASDHNPWIKNGDVGIVTALDITHDPVNGLDIDALSDALAATRDPRIKYLIANGFILIPSQGWIWQEYDGDPHTSHIHISVNLYNYDDITNWNLGVPMQKVSIELARIYFYYILHYDGLCRRENALNGECDGEIKNRHEGRENSIDYIRGLHNSPAAKQGREIHAGLWNEAQAWRNVNKNKSEKFELITEPVYKRVKE